MYSRIVLASLLFLLLTTTGWAGIQPRAFTLSPMVGGHIFDEDQNLDDAPFWSLNLGYNLTERATLEAVYSETDAKGKTTADSDAKVRTFRLDALYHFMPEKTLVPYLAIGFGEINRNPDVGRSRRHLLANVGGGLKYFFNDGVGLRADLRYLLDFPEPEQNLLYSVGLIFQFGAPTSTPMAVVVEQPASAPLPKPVPTPVPVLKQVQAPAPPPAPEPEKDSDADGVMDKQDKCLDTPAGVSIDSEGCPTKLTLKINFGLNSNRIDAEFDGEIAKAAQCINDYPGNLVYIDGHTDAQGAAEYNQQLSERRATAVKNRLTEKFNISAERMTARGFGESRPIADNSTKEGRFTNRRVDVACGASE